MLYDRCMGIYKFRNNTYPRRIRRRSNLGHIFREKSAAYWPGNTVILWVLEKRLVNLLLICKKKVAVNTADFWQNCVRQVRGSDSNVAEDTSYVVCVTVLLCE